MIIKINDTKRKIMIMIMITHTHKHTPTPTHPHTHTHTQTQPNPTKPKHNPQTISPQTINHFFPLFSGVALKWVRFSVPSWTKRGENAMLTCQFDLEGERLYSVKWYKAGREFYRYVPGDWPPQQQFPQHGISVDVSKGKGEVRGGEGK